MSSENPGVVAAEGERYMPRGRKFIAEQTIRKLREAEVALARGKPETGSDGRRVSPMTSRNSWGGASGWPRPRKVSPSRISANRSSLRPYRRPWYITAKNAERFAHPITLRSSVCNACKSAAERWPMTRMTSPCSMVLKKGLSTDALMSPAPRQSSTMASP